MPWPRVRKPGAAWSRPRSIGACQSQPSLHRLRTTTATGASVGRPTSSRAYVTTSAPTATTGSTAKEPSTRAGPRMAPRSRSTKRANSGHEPGHDRRENLGVDVPARDDSHTTTWSGQALERCRHRGAAGALGHDGGVLDNVADRRRHLGQAYDQRSGQEARRGRPHLWQQCRAADPVHERGGAWAWHRAAGRERRGKGRGRVHLAAIDPDLGTKAPYRGSDAAAQPAAAKWNEHCIHVGEVLEDLKADGAVAGHDVHIARRVDEMSGLERRVAMGRHHVPPFVVRQRDRLRPESLDGFQLHARGAVRDDRGAPDAKPPGVPRETLGHVAGAGCVDAGRQRRRIEHSERIRAAPNLERADRLQVLQLQVELARAAVLQSDQRGGRQDPGEALARLLHVVDYERIGRAVAHCFVAGGMAGSWARTRRATARTKAMASGP